MRWLRRRAHASTPDPVPHLWYAGNAVADGTPYSGWFLGSFINAGVGLRRTGVEVKWHVQRKGEKRDGWAAADHRTTITLLVTGRLKLVFNDGGSDHEAVTLASPGDYVVWRQVAHSWVVEQDGTTVVTIRWSE